MTREVFQQQAKDLSVAFGSVRGGPGDTLIDWSIRTFENDCFLVHSVVVSTCSSVASDVARQERSGEFEDRSILQDEASIAGEQVQSRQLEWRFSVVYSDTWKVPILYFTVQDTAGNGCLRDEMLTMLPKAETQDQWDFLSFEEHPVTGTPSCFLHPCQTEGRLKSLMASSDRSATLLSWFSLILPAVGHTISPKTFRELQQILL